MNSLGEATSSSLRRLNVINHILNATNQRPPFCVMRKLYTTETKKDDKDGNKKTFVRIGNSTIELKQVNMPEKIPRGYLSEFKSVMSDSQIYLKYLRWLMQKDELKQDSFLIGSPTGKFRRHLALSYAELTQREVEYLCLTRDTTESDIKQRREIVGSSVLYVNQCAVNAALNGRILIIEGIEKAERNLLPILNNLLENRELNLDDGHFLVSPERYDKLLKKAKELGHGNHSEDLRNLNLLRVHEDFRVIAIGLPVPKYKGNSLDPPLRSRFQAHLVSQPSYDDFIRYLKSDNKYIQHDLLKNLCDFGYSFYTPEMVSLNLPDFPVENLDKIAKIIDKCEQNAGKNYLNVSKLINKLFPHSLVLKDEDTNKKFYFELLEKFNLSKNASSSSNNKQNEIDYEMISVKNSNDTPNTKTLTFKSNNKLISIDMISGTSNSYGVKDNGSFIMNDYHSSQLVDSMLNHAAESDFCIIGPQGSGKTELIKQFAKLLNYDYQTIYLYKDMNARDLFQNRITLTNGNTVWQNSPLINASINGDLAVLDGIHRLNNDTIMSLRRLIQDRDVDLLDGSKLLRHDKYDSLMEEFKKKPHLKPQTKLLRIHPSFRIIATAEPPTSKASVKNPPDATNDSSKSSAPLVSAATKSSSQTDWLNSEVLNLFLFQPIEQLDMKYEHEVLEKKFKLNKQHDKLMDLMENLKLKGEEEIQLKHISKLFSLRKLIKLSNKLEKYPLLDLKELVENACLYKFMPQLNKQIFSEFLEKNGIINLPEESSTSQQESLDQLKNEFQQKLKTINDKLDDAKNVNTTLSELSKIPDTLFYENKLHTIILNNLMRDFELGEHLLLIGNQGTGKNKLVDKFLMLTKKPREYIQLHRDTTVHSLTIQPVIKSGVISYEDSPLVKAVKNGNIIVIDEADKAPLHVTCILKSLIESGEMVLSDGRRIVSSNYVLKPAEMNTTDRIIKMHKNFRMIILANRPGFPFLGNDFFAILGDLVSCHPIDNPDPVSEIEMLRMYAPHVSEKVLAKLVSAFGSLRKLSDQGLISYPYSTREIVNIVKHLEKFPDDSLANVLANVYDFDHYAEQNDLKSTFKEVMHKHGIPIGASSFQINLSKSIKMPSLLPMQKINLKLLNHEANNGFGISNIMNLRWNRLEELTQDDISNYKVENHEARVESFSELKSTWSFTNKQQIISDMMAVRNSDGKNDLVYISGIKPLSLTRLDTISSQAVELNLSNYFKTAWRIYFPRIKIFPVRNKPNEVLIYEETTHDLFKVDFDSLSVFKLEKNLIEAESNAAHLVNTAKKRINKYFIDQNQTYRMIPNGSGDVFVSYRGNSNELRLTYLEENKEINLNFEYQNAQDESIKLGINHVTQLSPDSILISGYDKRFILTSDDLKPSDLKYFILKYPLNTNNLSLSQLNNSEYFKFFMIDKNILGYNDDLVLHQVYLKEKQLNTDENQTQSFSKDIGSNKQPIVIPSIFTHFVALPNNQELNDTDVQVDSYFSRRETPLTNQKYDNRQSHVNFKIKNLTPIVKSIVNNDMNQIVTQLTRQAIPKSVLPDAKTNLTSCLGYIELIDLDQKNIRYIEVPKPNNSRLSQNNQAWNSYSHLSVINETEFLIETSPSKPGNIWTLDFYGNLSEWETSTMRLKRSLDEWQKIIMDKESSKLSIDIFNESPNKELRDFKGPKHGKVDEKNEPHVGGNQWAGGSGGFDTAGLGGVGGPYRLDSGNKVFQVSDQMKQSVPENVKKAAKEMAEKAFKQRLREINMSEFEHDLYKQYLENVKKPIQQLRNILDGLEAKKKERQWLKNQTQGDLDESKLVEAITGDKNVFRRRGDDPNADNSFNMEKPKRLKLVVDCSGSMYRFNGVDNRLERELESVLMVMESFSGYEDKIRYDIIGHSGDSYNIKFVDAQTPPKNEAERLKILKTILAHAQFCSSGDHTFEATKFAIQEVSKEEADDYFVIVLSDANFDRYGLSPRGFSRIMLETDHKVNVFCIFIGTLGDQAVTLKKNLPSGKSFVCMNTQEVPKIMQQIFQAAMLNQ